jgi:hypothetical protein
MSYDGEYGASETCRHDMYYRSCMVCSTIGAHPTEERFAQRMEELRALGLDTVTAAAVTVPVPYTGASLEYANAVTSELITQVALSRQAKIPVATEAVWLVRESGFNVYFASEAAAVAYGYANEARVYEVPLFYTAESAAQRVIEGVDMDFFDKPLCGDRIDPATGKKSWGYLDLRDGLANDPEWLQYRALKEKFEPDPDRA